MKLLKTFLLIFIFIFGFALAQSAGAVEINFFFPLPVNPVLPSGTLSATNCVIPPYGSSCTSNISWTTSGTTSSSRVRIYDSAVYTNPGYPNTTAQQAQYVSGTNYPNTTSNTNLSGTNVSGTIPYTGNTPHTLELYDIRSNVANQPDPNGNQWYLNKLATATVTATCDPNTQWNGTNCAVVPVVAQVTSEPTCDIPANGSTCSVDVYWTSNNTLPSSVRRDTANEISTLANLSQQQAVSITLSKGSHTFGFYYNSAGTWYLVGPSVDTSVADCISGTVWNGSVCASASIAATPTCPIVQNASTCTVGVTWSSSGAANPSIRQDGIQFSTAATNPTNPIPLRAISNGSHSFTFHSGSTLLGTATSVASCIPNTSWNGTMCVPVATGNIVSSTSCDIPANASTCPVSVTWTTSAAITGLGIFQGATQFSTAATNPTNPIPLRNISHGTESFSIYGINGANTILYDVSYSTGACISGTSWNGTVCTSTFINSDPTCTISANASSCTVGVSWASTGLSSPIIKQDGTQFSTSANQSTPTQKTISHGSHSFTIYDGSTLLGTATSAAICEYGSNWDGTACDPFPTATIASSPMCSIAVNASACDVDVIWTSANLASPIIKEDGNQFATNANQSSPVTKTISRGTHSFTIYDRFTLMDTSTSTADCLPGATWNGTACVMPSSATISSTPTCAIPTNASNCSVTVSWSSNGLASPIIKQDGSQFSTASANPGTSKTISHGSHSFTISDGASILDTATSGAWCISSAVWNGGACIGNLGATLDASPSTIESGNTSTLTWGSSGAAYCKGTGFNTNNLTSGSVIVKPKTTTTYSVICYDSFNTGSSASAKVTVGKIQTIYSEGGL